MAVRKATGGGGDPAALTSAAVEARPGVPYPALFKVEFGGRFRFELGGNCTEVRVIGFFPDIGCQKTWTLPFGPGWAESAMTTIRAWKATRAQAA